MMRAVAELTREYGIKTVVSMNPIMIDGTGMWGMQTDRRRRGQICLCDGPEFDAHQIDWDEAMKRLTQYKREEHDCRLMRQFQRKA